MLNSVRFIILIHIDLLEFEFSLLTSSSINSGINISSGILVPAPDKAYG